MASRKASSLPVSPVFAGGLHDGYALMSISLAGFVVATVLQEFQRGIRARMTMHSEAMVVALQRRARLPSAAIRRNQTGPLAISNYAASSSLCVV